MSKRIHELAKEWGVSPKDLSTAAERLNLGAKRSQSSVTDEEAQRLKEALGLVPKPAVTLGAQRIVSERMVTDRDTPTQLVTAREQTTETRLRANVIRRRTAREVVRREELPAAVPGEAEDIPPPLDFELPDIPPGLPEPPPQRLAEAPASSLPVETPAPAAPAPVVEQAPEPSVVADAPAPAPEPKVVTPPAPPVVAPPPARPSPAAKPAPAPPPAATETSARPSETVARPGVVTPEVKPTTEMRGPKVLGKIDLRRAASGPPQASGWRPAEPAAQPPGPLGLGDAARKKRAGRKVIEKDRFDAGPDAGRGSKRPQKRRALPGKELRKTEITVPSARKRIVRISEVITVADLAKAMGVKASEVMKKLLDMGSLATINQALDFDTAALVAGEFEYQVENIAVDVEQELEVAEAGGEEHRVPRAPVVTIMGHVDHGKTSLLDAIRATDVAAGEAGGITQHIGAYSVDVGGRHVTFLDTPGHEAFTAMRARGAKVTDLVVLVVAADDGIMPQTVEAINHARAAEVPIVVAVNKIDKPEANLDRVKQELGNYGLAPEDWGGDTIVVGVSAKTKAGVPQLLEMLLLQADVLELRANPNRNAKGTIVEARLDRGRGPVATVLVQEGTLKVGDAVVCGTQYGRIRAMVDDKGKRMEQAGPATPVEVLGLGGVPEAGDALVSLQDEQKARQIADHRREKQRDVEIAKTAKVSLDEIYKQIQSGEVRELKVVIKADVHGSVEAVSDALVRLSTDEVRLTVVHGAVGGITESDVLLASASNAVVIGFNVRPEPKAAALAEREGVDIRPYSIIYEAVNDVRDALEGLLEPEFREKVLGRAEVRQTFSISGIGMICGSFVLDGKLTRGAKARLLRDNIVVHDGVIGSLRRFKDDVREVQGGYECGIGLEGYQDIKVGDVIEAYEMEQIARRLQPQSGRGGHAAERSA